MKISNYKRTDDTISYTVIAVGRSIDIEHFQVTLGHVRVTNTHDFLEIVASYNVEYVDLIEQFVELQTTILSHDMPFEWEAK